MLCYQSQRIYNPMYVFVYMYSNHTNHMVPSPFKNVRRLFKAQLIVFLHYL